MAQSHTLDALTHTLDALNQALTASGCTITTTDNSFYIDSGDSSGWTTGSITPYRPRRRIMSDFGWLDYAAAAWAEKHSATDTNQQPTPDNTMQGFIVIRDGDFKSFDAKEYDTKKKALNAAERYARKHEDRFYVFKPVSFCETEAPVVTKDLEG